VIDTADTLAPFLERLQEAPWVALDTEADSLHAYPAKLCLLQFGLPTGQWLVDPLSSIDCTPLWKCLEGRQLLLHGSDYDLRLLYGTYRFVPARIFDTMLAARILGVREFGLHALLRDWLNVPLDKGPQKANWARRPLTERMTAYALNDVRHLKPLADRLADRLDTLGRRHWHEQLCARLVETCAREEAQVDEEPWRIRGANRLPRRALAVLRELWHWREREAIAANRPPYFVLSHELLLGLAEAAANDHAVESQLPSWLSHRRRDGLLATVQRALETPESQWPKPFRPQGRRLTIAQRHRLDRLERHRDEQSARLQIDPSLLASRSTLTALAADWDRNSALLLPWQRQLLDLHA